MGYNICLIGTYPTASYDEECGVGIFGSDQLSGLAKRKQFSRFRVVAISSRKRETEIPVDIVIQKYNQNSWTHAGNYLENKLIEAKDENTRDVILYQYEGGLIPKFNKKGKVIAEVDGRGYSNLLKQLSRDSERLQFVQMHTVKPIKKASRDYIRNIKDFGKYADGIIVMIEDSKRLLVEQYGISPSKIKVIPHGIRENKETWEEARKRLNIPLDLELISEPGLRSLNKGNHTFIRANAKFVDESLTTSQREKYCGFLAGRLHPEFINQEGGIYAQRYDEETKKIIDSVKIHRTPIRIQTIKDIKKADWGKNDIVILDKFLELPNLLGVYASSDIIFTPYPELDQSSSGAGADSEGSGTPLISTKTRWACSTLKPYGPVKRRGIDITDRGILIDNGPKSCVNQGAAGIHYLIFNKDKDGQLSRTNMAHKAYEAGLSKTWPEASKGLLEFIETIARRKGGTETISLKKQKDSPRLESILSD